jgi:tetratricopeptide (TPR) repeat protein
LTGAALDEAIARSASGVSDFLHALSLTIKGMLRFVTDDLESGMALIEEARRIQERLNDREGGGMALSFLAQMSFAKGDHARALALYGEALEAPATIGDQPEVARVHCEMGWTALASGDAPAAQRAFRLGVQANEEVGSPKGTGLALLGLAAVEAAEGRSERAVAIAAAAHALSERAGIVIAHPMDPGSSAASMRSKCQSRKARWTGSSRTRVCCRRRRSWRWSVKRAGKQESLDAFGRPHYAPRSCSREKESP